MDSIRCEVRKRTSCLLYCLTIDDTPFTAGVDFAEADQEHQILLCAVLCALCLCLPSRCCLAPFVPALARPLCDSLSYFTHSSRAEALSFMRSELQLLCIEAHRRRKEVRNAKHPRKLPLFGRGKGKLIWNT